MYCVEEENLRLILALFICFILCIMGGFAVTASIIMRTQDNKFLERNIESGIEEYRMNTRRAEKLYRPYMPLSEFNTILYICDFEKNNPKCWDREVNKLSRSKL